MKKRRFGVGKWNGYGGKVEGSETIEESLHREIMEEGGIEVKNPQKLGILEFEFPHTGLVIENHVFKAVDFIGEPVETEEMRPKWFPENEMPFKDMWADDPYWIKMFLENKKFKGRFVFGENEEILDSQLEEVEEI